MVSWSESVGCPGHTGLICNVLDLKDLDPGHDTIWERVIFQNDNQCFNNLQHFNYLQILNKIWVIFQNGCSSSTFGYFFFLSSDPFWAPFLLVFPWPTSSVRSDRVHVESENEEKDSLDTVKALWVWSREPEIVDDWRRVSFGPFSKWWLHLW